MPHINLQKKVNVYAVDACNTGALDSAFASELLERASQEASTGSLALADLSDLMSALGSSG